MAVTQLKDGRWTVNYRIKGTKKIKRIYFGRGPEAEAAALEHNRALGFGDPNPKARRRKDVDEKINHVKNGMADDIYKKIIGKIELDRKRRLIKKGNKPTITEKEVTAILLLEIARSKPDYPVCAGVKNPNGYADIITKYEIIEVKCLHEWKQAIGQVNAYHVYYPEHKKRIHLFGSSKLSNLAILKVKIRRECKRNKIKATFHLT